MLARQYDTTVEAIISANPDVDPQKLMPGQVICIPQQQIYPPCPEGNYYTIRAGDTLYRIARQFNVSLDDLLEANPAIDPFSLQVGQVICIPLATPPVTCPEGYSQYTVKAGDTYTTIARQYGITVEALGAANPTINPTRLLIGQILCIPPAPEGCPEGYTQHTVKAGDSFYKLARQYGVAVAVIEAANPGADPNRLTIGQKLCIPPAGTCPQGYTQYTVKSGDTLYKLAQQYGVSLDSLLTANPGVDPRSLQIGQKLCVPAST